MDKIQNLGDSKCETLLSKIHRIENTTQFSAKLGRGRCD